MSSDIHQAFAHPEARAAATAHPDPRDRISLRDHVVEVEIGAFQAERGTVQRVRFNIVVEVARRDHPIDDDVDRILSYDKVTEAIAAELAAERVNLLETLAERVAMRILAEPQARRVFVRVEKLDRGPGALGVEIVRSQSELPARPTGQGSGAAGIQPSLVFLSNAAIASPALTTLIERLNANARALILCVGLPDIAPPQTAAPAAQRRIDLLAIEQNAWVLAGRDRRCVVVGTRTELDWSVKNGQIAVWAPSKIVLDAVESPRTDPRRALDLSLWLAGQIGAAEMIVIGTEAPTEGPVPIRQAAIPD